MPTNGGWGNTFFYNRLSDGAGCGEIDIIETSPDWKGGYCITEHYWDPTSGGKLASSYSELRSESLTNNEYAQLAVVWAENTLYYYCDGELVRTYRNLEATENDAFILLSLGCGSFDRNQNSWVGWLTEEQVEKQVSYFDYVRVYKAG